MISNWSSMRWRASGEFRRPRVTLNPHKELYLGVMAVELIGRPKAVRLYFDVAASLIGVMPVAERTENSFPLHRIGKYPTICSCGDVLHNFGRKPDAGSSSGCKGRPRRDDGARSEDGGRLRR